MIIEHKTVSVMRVIKNVLNFYGDIWRWVKNPKEGFLQDTSFRAKSIKLFQIFILDFLAAGVFGLTLGYINNSVQRLETPLEAMNLLELMILLSLAAPIIEEIIFRLPLVYKRNYIARGLDKVTNGFVARKWDSLYRYFVYIMAVGFGFIHLANFSDISFLLLVLSPIVIGSQLVGGLMISYVRVKFGFMWAVAHHVIFNTIIGLFVLLTHNSVIMQVSNSDIELDIRSLEYVDSANSSLDIKIENSKIFSIKANDYQLQEVFDNVSDKDIEVYNNVWVDIDFESKAGITPTELTELLKTEIRTL